VRRTCLFAIVVSACGQGGKSQEDKPRSVPVRPDDRVVEEPLTALPEVPTWIHDPPDALRDKVTSVGGQLFVMRSKGPLTDYRTLLPIVEASPGVVAAEPFTLLETEVTSASRDRVSLAIKAVDPTRVARVLQLESRMKSGSLESLGVDPPASIVLGDDLARFLDVEVGDLVTVKSPASLPPSYAPKAIRVSGTFHVGFDEYDARYGLVSVTTLQAMLGRSDVMGIEAAVDDIDRSEEIAAEIRAKLDGDYVVWDWFDANKALFTKVYGGRRP
jgi:ABC-type lipoprotein release transport system permease subunit